MTFAPFFVVDTIGAITSVEELAAGASIAHDGLVVPLPRFPAPAGLGTRPSSANVIGPSNFEQYFSCDCSWVLCLPPANFQCFNVAQVPPIHRSQVGLT